MSSKRRLTELDALRGIAALMVTVYHFLLGRVNHDSVMKFGTTGVDLFFVISGFVIFMTIERCTTAKEFIVSRFSRLYPAYWICVTLTFLLILLALQLGFHQDQKNNLPTVFVVNLTMLQHYFNIRDLDGQYWTLTVELVFYVLMLLLMMSRMLKHIKIIGAAVLCVLLCWRFFYTQISSTQVHSLLLYWVPLLRYFPLFFAGILFYDCSINGTGRTNIFLIIVCYLTQVYVYDQFHRHIWILSQIEFACILIVYFASFVLFVFRKLSWIVNRYTLLLGEISYSLYLIHNFAGAKVVMPFLMKVAGLPLWTSTFIALLIVVSMAYAIHRFVEKPAMLAIRKKLLPEK
jgi:peptidoglycan/LPS O-acetylase OafA/YrhL